MRIIIGRGKNREIYDLPCAEIVKRSPAHEVSALRDNICVIIGIA